MNQWDYLECKIAEYYILALEYGDFGDMTASEVAQFNNWLEKKQDGVVGHWSIEEHDGGDFGVCAVTGLFANRATLRFNFKAKD